MFYAISFKVLINAIFFIRTNSFLNSQFLDYFCWKTTSFFKTKRDKMQRFQFQSLRNADRKRRNIIFLLSALGVVLLISISVGIFYGVKKKNDVQLADDDIVVTSVSVCAYIPDDEKLDCYADASALVDEDACVGRGCCYSGPKNVSFSSSPPTLDVPSCYYPSNYSGYSIQSVKESPSSKRIKLKRVQPSGFPKDILNVDILVYYIDDNSLRIKVCYILI